MKLLSLHIENFGKLHNFYYTFSPNLNVLLKENGWGKTTLSIFLKAMFYGMPAKTRGDEYKSERSRYMPWQGGAYGGYVEFEKDEKKYRVTRYFGKTPEADTFELFDYQTNTTVKSENTPLGVEIFGIGEESFRMTAFFPQMNFRSATNPELTASLTGVNQYQNDLACIDSAIKRLKERRLSLKRQLPDKAETEKLRLTCNDLKNQSAQLENQISDCQDKLLNLQQQQEILSKQTEIEREKYKIAFQNFEKNQEIEKQISQISQDISQQYLKQSELQKQAISNLQNLERAGSPNKFIYATISICAALIVILAILFATKSISLLTFIIISCFLVIFTTIAVIAVIKVKKKQHHQSNDNSFETLVQKSQQVIKELEAKLEILKNMQNESKSSQPDSTSLENAKDSQSDCEIAIITTENEIKTNRTNLDRVLDEIERYQSLRDTSLALEKDLNHKLLLLDKTISYLTTAKDNVSSRYVSFINKEFTDIIGKFGVDGNRFLIDNQWKVKEQTDLGSKEYEFSSYGYQDIISFCQRISLISRIYTSCKPFILLDDTFVNLDDHMLACAKEVVGQLAKNYQVIYICCNSRSSFQ